VLVLAVGCEKDAADRGDTAAISAAANACQPPAPVRGMARDRFLEWAREVSYYGTDSTRGRVSSFDPGDSVQVQVSQGMDTVSRTTLARGCVIARIIARGADAAFGIKADTAYVWADSTNPFTATIIPDDGSAGVVYNMDVEPTGGIAPTTTSVPKHICSQCGTNDWCVYPRDEVRLTEEMFVGSAATPGGVGGAIALNASASSP
jgi:hypothetical protein